MTIFNDDLEPDGGFDFELDDAYDTAPADPTQVAIRLHVYRIDGGLEPNVDWDDLELETRIMRVEVVARLLDWLRGSGVTRG